MVDPEINKQPFYLVSNKDGTFKPDYTRVPPVYLDALQCARVNAALDRLQALPRDFSEIYIVTTSFQVDLEWDNSYLTD